MIRVLIVDDSIFIRTILKDILGAAPGIEIVGSASDGEEALRMIEELRPDAMTLDIEMPKITGIEVLKRLKNAGYRPKILMLSSLTSKDAEHTRLALSLGADDFMLKPQDIFRVRGLKEELVAKIRHLIEIRPAQKVRSASDELATHVVLFGSSAGGLQQLDRVLSNLSPEMTAGIIITQHMPEGFTAALAERFNRICPLPVHESENGHLIKKGEVIVCKAGFHSVISSLLTKEGKTGGKIVHSTAPPVHAVRPAIDKTFSSAARTYRHNTLAVVLSGMGNDCGDGAADIKAAGGTVFVCKEEDCLVYGMARSALKRNSVDKVLPLADIPGEVLKATRTMEMGNV